MVICAQKLLSSHAKCTLSTWWASRTESAIKGIIQLISLQLQSLSLKRLSMVHVKATYQQMLQLPLCLTQQCGQASIYYPPAAATLYVNCHLIKTSEVYSFRAAKYNKRRTVWRDFKEQLLGCRASCSRICVRSQHQQSWPLFNLCVEAIQCDCFNSSWLLGCRASCSCVSVHTQHQQLWLLHHSCDCFNSISLLDAEVQSYDYL